MAKESKNTVLVVDDEPGSLGMLNDYLCSRGFKTLVAEDGETALKRVSHARPDIILMDVMMPGIDGFETCYRLKEDDRTKDIPILFMTALTDVVDKVKGFEVGAVDFITKPIHVEEVVARINTHLTIRNLQKTLEEQNAQLQQEIAERKRAEEKVKAALEEREMLIKEIHHRVKNNLQTVSSIFSLQSRYIKDEQALGVFKNCRQRIQAMSLIHEKLYQSMDLSKVGFRGYIQNLVTQLLNSYVLKPGQVQLKMQIENLVLDVKKAIPLGLIINELISNSLKHAFPDHREGKITICLRLNESETYDFTLIVKDNGAGFPENLDFQDTKSFGMVMVHSLVKQLDGVIEMERNDGTTFILRFKQMKHEKGPENT